MARTLSGTAQYLTVASALATIPVTFECWFNASSTATTQALMSICSTTVQDALLLTLQSTAVLRASSSHSNSAQVASSIATVSTGTWNHCVAVFASTTSRTVYLNGVGASGSASSVPTSLNISAIGASFNGSVTAGNLTHGTVAFPAFYKVAWTQTDVNASLAAGSGRLVQPSQLVGYARLTGSSPEPDLIFSPGWTVTGSPTVAANPPIYVA